MSTGTYISSRSWIDTRRISSIIASRKNPVDARVGPSKLTEVVGVECQGLALTKGDEGGVPRRWVDQGEFTEDLPVAEHPEHGDIAKGGGDPDGHMALQEQMEGVAGVTLTKGSPRCG